jgi:hypothetical protein
LAACGCAIVVGLAFVAPWQASADQSLPGLVGWWPFDDNANDVSGYGNNGIFTGSYAPGKFGDAVDLSTGGSVVVPDNSSLDPQDVTVEAWVNNTNPGNFKYIF